MIELNIFKWLTSDKMTAEELADKCRKDAAKKGSKVTVEKTKFGYKIKDGRNSYEIGTF